MGMLDGVLGNAAKIAPSLIQRELAPVLLPGERVEHAYKLIRDFFVFTDKRLIMVDKQGITGNKMSFHSIPYTTITRFSVETAGTLDLESELRIWVVGDGVPYQKAFKKQLDIFEVQSVLASYVLR